VFTALLLALTLTVSGFAQNKPAPAQTAAAPQRYAMTVAQIKPGMTIEWENFLKKDAIPLMKKAGIKDMGILKTNGFGISDTYFFMSPFKSMAEFDAPDPVLKVMGPDTLAVMMPVMERCLSSARTYILTARPDLSVEPKPGYNIKMGVLVTASVAPGRNEEYEKIIKDIGAVAAKSGAKAFLVARVGLGGNPNEYQIFVGLDSFTDFENFGQAFTKAMPEAKLAPQTGITMWSEMISIAAVPELSIDPTAP
jgi:hypothetical protein